MLPVQKDYRSLRVGCRGVRLLVLVSLSCNDEGSAWSGQLLIPEIMVACEQRGRPNSAVAVTGREDKRRGVSKSRRSGLDADDPVIQAVQQVRGARSALVLSKLAGWLPHIRSGGYARPWRSRLSESSGRRGIIHIAALNSGANPSDMFGCVMDAVKANV